MVSSVLLALALAAQDPKKQAPSQGDIDAAVDRGAEYLLALADKGLGAPTSSARGLCYDELVLYTLVHAGADSNHPGYRKVLDSTRTRAIERTYQAALTAMALQAIDAAKHQERIAECAQFLVDVQAENGQWSYGEPGPPADRGTPTEGKPGAPPAPPPEETTALKRIKIERRRRGPADGDNSNSQYAALGLRACVRADIDVPVKTLTDAADWWIKSQGADGGWSYSASGGLGEETYGTMTAGGAGSLAIYKAITPRGFKGDAAMTKGVAWIASKWSVTASPRIPDTDTKMWLYYWLYGIERVGSLLNTEKIGNAEWYTEGAAFLLGAQSRRDGSWKSKAYTITEDTCWAILFLRRATKAREKVASTPAKQR